MLAAPEGYRRVFLDEGPAIAALLAQSVERRAQDDPISVHVERLGLVKKQLPVLATGYLAPHQRFGGESYNSRPDRHRAVRD